MIEIQMQQERATSTGNGDTNSLVSCCLAQGPWGPSMGPAEQNNWFRLLLWST